MSPSLLKEFDGPSPVVLHFGPMLQKLNDREFFEFCQLNRDKRIERTAEGDLILMPPTGGETGHRNFVLYGLFNEWAESDGSGIAFDSSTGFLLPNGALRSPDLAWISLDRWNLEHRSKRRVYSAVP
jgi:Uma2 family endonuclease